MTRNSPKRLKWSETPRNLIRGGIWGYLVPVCMVRDFPSVLAGTERNIQLCKTSNSTTPPVAKTPPNLFAASTTVAAMSQFKSAEPAWLLQWKRKKTSFQERRSLRYATTSVCCATQTGLSSPPWMKNQGSSCWIGRILLMTSSSCLINYWTRRWLTWHGRSPWTFRLVKRSLGPGKWLSLRFKHCTTLYSAHRT